MKKLLLVGFGLAFSTSLFAAEVKLEAGKVGGGPDPVICRREVPVGSLIATRKVCLTKSQWVQREARGNEEARRQVEDNAAKNPTPSN